MGFFGIAMYFAKGSYGWSGSDAVGVGARWRIVIVPLNAYLQQRSEKGEKGRMIATNNLYTR